MNLTGVARQADRLLESAVKILDPGWQAAVLSYGMVVYKDNKVYKYAAQVFKAAS